MKKLIALLVVVMCGVSFAANEGALADTGSVNRSTANRVFDLHTANTAASLDTFATTKLRYYGPYDLAPFDGGPQAHGFHMYFQAVTGTTPTMSFGYELISGEEITDTLGNWTEVDTLDGTASSSYHSIDSTAAKAIVFRVDNYDDTASQIPGWLRVVFKDAVVFNKDRR